MARGDRRWYRRLPVRGDDEQRPRGLRQRNIDPAEATRELVPRVLGPIVQSMKKHGPAPCGMKSVGNFMRWLLLDACSSSVFHLVRPHARAMGAAGSVR